ncbi:MAG: gamma-glutamyl-phosphate reductase, partial [Proteobacteria bacterium]|nr:gamma-glutamyl-phosphate reductase [Pseudomonadota bacterium]
MSNQIDNLSSIIAATKRSSSELGQASIEMRNNWLVAIKRSLLASIPEILSANEIDIEVALKQGLSKALIDRLTLNQSRLQQIVQSIEDIIAEKDPLN